MSGNTDPRVEAVARIIREADVMPGNLTPPLDLYLGDAQQALVNADEADRAAGIVRVRADDETVERVQAALKESLFDRGQRVHEWPDDEAAAYRDNGGFMEGVAAAEEIRFRKAARSVLAALRGES